MLTRIVLTGISVAALAGGSTTALISSAGNEHGLVQRAPRAAEAQAKAGTNDATEVEAADVQLPPCPADVKNHGAYVSSVAKANHGHRDKSKDKPKPEVKPSKPEGEPGAHGALVSAAAQSDCGKPEGAEAGDATESAAEKAAAAKAKAEREAAKEKAKASKSPAPGKPSATPSQATQTP